MYLVDGPFKLEGNPIHTTHCPSWVPYFGRFLRYCAFLRSSSEITLGDFAWTNICMCFPSLESKHDSRRIESGMTDVRICTYRKMSTSMIMPELEMTQTLVNVAMTHLILLRETLSLHHLGVKRHHSQLLGGLKPAH